MAQGNSALNEVIQIFLGTSLLTCFSSKWNGLFIIFGPDH